MATKPTDPGAGAAGLAAIATSLDGRLILPSDAEWDVARSVWNGMIDRQPMGVLRQPHARGGHYVNFLGAEDRQETRTQLREIYAPGIYDRLAALKDTWDPTNLFRLNHNIPPSGG